MRNLADVITQEERNLLLESRLLVGQPSDLVGKLVEAGEVREYEEGERIYQKGDTADGLRFVLSGRVRLEDAGWTLSYRLRGTSFGSWPILEPGLPFRVSAYADPDDKGRRTRILLVPIDQFREIANAHPGLWLRIAKLQMQRAKTLDAVRRIVNDPPKLRIFSLTKDLRPVAQELERLLRKDEDLVEVDTWTDGFGGSITNIEQLERWGREIDFAVIVLSPVAKVTAGSKERFIAGENVLIEAGFFMGALGRDRTWLIMPGKEQADLPSNLLGINPYPYQLDSSGKARLGGIAAEIRHLVSEKKGKLRYEEKITYEPEEADT